MSDWVVLVEAYDQEALMQANAELAGGDDLVAHGAGDEIAARLYCLDFTLDDQEAKRIWRPPSEAPAA